MSSGIDVRQYMPSSDELREIAKSAEPVGAVGGYLQHWSPSSFAMARRCPYQWQQRYIHGRKERPGEAPLIGSAVHAGVERNFTQKIRTHEDMPMVDLLGWYDDEGFLKTLAAEMEKAQEEVLWDTSPEAARARGRAMLSAYHATVAERVQPIGVEGKVSVDFGLAVPVEGRYDVLRESSVIDLKTGKRKQAKPKESWRIQAAVYGEAAGRPVEFHSVSATANNSVTIVTPLESESLLIQPTAREREHLRVTLRAIAAEIEMYLQVFGPDEPWPFHGRFHDWACSYCGFRPTCPAWEE